MSKYNRTQSFEIKSTPALVDEERVYPNKGVLIMECSDEFYVYDCADGLWISWTFGAVAVAIGLFVFIQYEHDNLWEYIETSAILIAGMFFLAYGLTADKNKKMFILDRLKGVVSYPDSFYLPPLKGKFNELKAVVSVSGDVDGVVGREYLKFVNTFKPRKLDVLRTITYNNPQEEWNLYVWYMDKNRPLPPGTAFDPYRQKDFERRKAEGFPKPLYSSNVPTPEATPEQQKERKKIGGW